MAFRGECGLSGFPYSTTCDCVVDSARFKRLPRAQLSVDHASINSNDSIGPASSTYSRDPLLNQSAVSVRKIHPPKRRYPASLDSTSQSQLDNTVTGCVQDDLDASGHFESDHESKDGLTNF